MRKEEYIDRPPGPFGGLWSLWYLDPIATIKREIKGFRKVRHKAFAEKIHAGDPAPEVKLKTTDGREVDFAQFRGKRNIVVEFGAIT
ncbi:MAG: hypothetical protein HYY53_02105 [candidate division NC10 bacterium]|uniref:Alkyl hydroperoxide reductase subunit C/ Thiol specific antioxidant domain-containing protein n=1 Tax=Tectimicrobiota bacterium TaxID=2528274 RepID=A0A932I1T6_UNCTE|nr:hypothetical protein [candidate division NC10 bacterium]MBI3128345.1 hypothetical protein [Candidatus Tectomicrobia bacterium]